MDLKNLETLKGANNIIKNCAGVKKKENLLIITDRNKAEVAEYLALVAEELGIEYAVIIMPKRELGVEPSEMIIWAMKKADVIVVATTVTMYHSKSILDARAQGARVITLTGATPETLARPAMLFNFSAYTPTVDKVAHLFKNSNKIKVTSPGGTCLEAIIKGRRINADSGLCYNPGQAIGLPDIEVNVSPVEDSTNGTIVIDASMSILGLLKNPITLEIKNGKIVKIKGKEEAQKMSEILSNKKDAGVYTIAEIAIGLNPMARVEGILIEDEGTLGTMHFGIGDNLNLGGKNKASLHMDVIVYRPTILIDNKILCKEGELQV